MELIKLFTEFIACRLHDPSHIQRYGAIGNMLIAILLSAGLFGIAFGCAGMVFAANYNETVLEWAFDGVLIGLAVFAIIAVASLALYSPKV